MKDSAKSFSFKVKFLNNDEFKVADGAAVYRFGQEFTTANGVFSLQKIMVVRAPILTTSFGKQLNRQLPLMLMLCKLCQKLWEQAY
ncbi:MAG: hypothetical protein IPH18_11105 [Chitinophagaceae bacterium]|nr:hypothetical protein [Chitinophagaceae bacterium]